jgi:hypothetical protein
MTKPASERRQAPRHRHSEDHGIESARVRPGHAAKVIDVSAGGALIETHHRLLPGTIVELRVERDGNTATVRGRVLRCAVVGVRPAWVCYRGAIGFERQLSWLLDHGGAEERWHPARPVLPERAPVTREAM